MKAAWVLLGVILGPTGPYDRYPTRLRNILDSQRATTSQVEWTSSWIGGRDDGLVERYVTRKAGDAAWESNLGDENGYHPTGYSADRDYRSEKNPPQHGTPEEELPVIDEQWLRKHELPKEQLAGTRNSLISDGQAWYLPYAERPQSGDTQPVEETRAYLPVDLPSIGLAPGWVSDLGANPFHLPERELEGFESATFREGVENGLPTVSAEWGGSSRLTWRFDDRQGGKPVWAGLERNGELAGYSETEYERIGERWFPKSVRFYQGDSTTPYKMIDVQRATFDEPWHMQEITPTDIGALNGTQFGTPEGVKAWTGVELIPVQEYFDLVNLDGVLPDPKILEMTAKMLGQTLEEHLQFLQRRSVQEREAYRKKYGEEPWLVKKSAKEKDEWDVYVDKFLTEHKLPEPGVKRANEIRDQSKKLRDAYRRKNAAALRKAKEENDPRKVAEYEGIEKRIFDRVLVRDLKRLLPAEKGAPKKAP
jgi:hypothetical protein